MRVHTWERVLGHRRAQVVANGRREGEKRFRGRDAHGVPPFVLRARRAVAVAVEPRADPAATHVRAAARQIAAEDVPRHHHARP